MIFKMAEEEMLCLATEKNYRNLQRLLFVSHESKATYDSGPPKFNLEDQTDQQALTNLSSTKTIFVDWQEALQYQSKFDCQIVAFALEQMLCVFCYVV